MDNNIYITDKLCSRGCGKTANHISKKGIYFYEKNAAKCPVVNPKGKKKKARKEPEIIDYYELCEYGCGEIAKYKFLNGKHCCAKSGGNCSHIRISATKKATKKKYEIQENGKTLVHNTAMKISENKRNNIDENGVNMHMRSARKVSEIKASNINDDGLNVHQLTGLKYKEWSETEDGKIFIERKRLEQIKIMNTINDDGVKESKRRSNLMVETKINDIDENGLNGFERSHLKCKNSGFVNGIFYQSSNEKRFLESLDQKVDVKRGPCIRYVWETEFRRYMPDYMIENKIYEIKSKYTMFGPNNEFLLGNIIKITAAAKKGYEVYVVIDDEVISFSDFIINLEEDQYLSIPLSVYSDSLSFARSLIV